MVGSVGDQPPPRREVVARQQRGRLVEYPVDRRESPVVPGADEELQRADRPPARRRRQRHPTRRQHTAHQRRFERPGIPPRPMRLRRRDHQFESDLRRATRVRQQDRPGEPPQGLAPMRGDDVVPVGLGGAEEPLLAGVGDEPPGAPVGGQDRHPGAERPGGGIGRPGIHTEPGPDPRRDVRIGAPQQHLGRRRSTIHPINPHSATPRIRPTIGHGARYARGRRRESPRARTVAPTLPGTGPPRDRPTSPESSAASRRRELYTSAPYARSVPAVLSIAWPWGNGPTYARRTTGRRPPHRGVASPRAAPGRIHRHSPGTVHHHHHHHHRRGLPTPHGTTFAPSRCE